MRERWVFRPYVARIQLAGALLVSVIAVVDILVFFFEARRVHPSSGFGLFVTTLTIVVFALGAGAVQGYRVVRQARSRLKAGDRSALLVLVSRQFLLIIAMAGVGCVTIIVSLSFLTERLIWK
jgi:hypothetical protein